MRYLLGSSTEADHQCAAKALCDFHNGLSKDSPGNMWLHAVEHHHVARTLGVTNNGELVFWPTNLAVTISIGEYFGAFLCEVKERVGVDIGNNCEIAFLQHPIKCRCCNAADVEEATQCNQHHRVAQWLNVIPIGFEDFFD